VYDGCTTGENRWDPDRGELYPFLEQLVRRLVTDDKKKFSKRPAALSYEADEVDVETTQVTSELLNALYNDADDDLQELILVLQELVEMDGTVNWTAVRQKLNGVSRYELDKRRERLRGLLTKHDMHPTPQEPVK
jgi:hypothetical protein